MNTIFLPTANSDDSTNAREPQPIAVVMTAVLARYDLLRAQEPSRQVNHRIGHSVQPRQRLAVA